ncbi:alkaline phosphatase [Stomoxys calcitrans]|uniref:alkaline phosphatase n=1 Tax=Stomoxys calcitrans TaxID=35570 RepID=UPI0027E37A5D|nr:alkaline phosphatase [Stomoxys calcitrans]XP_059223804.1 alkaline phosphatase [Stomoxys calcitrans]
MDTDRKHITSESVNSSLDLPMDAYSQNSNDDLKPRKHRVYKSKVFIIAISFSSILLLVMTAAFIVHYTVGFPSSLLPEEGEKEALIMDMPEEQREWVESGLRELKTAVHRVDNKRRAKNVILFVGDGMGPNTVTAARIMGFKEEGLMSWEKFPDMGLLKTYCANKQVPDSFSTATALFSGIKINYETGGVDSSVSLGNCSASLNHEHHVQSILKLAQDDGKLTGFVTTTRVTHATPAALYAHTPDRRWECEKTMPATAIGEGCRDIARQLIEDPTGQKINVIMGGGRQMLVSNVTGSLADPIDTWSCKSADGRNLIKEWASVKKANNEAFVVAQNTGELEAIDAENTDYVLGIFANGHLMYDFERDTSAKGMPSLKQMTLKALEVLRSKNQGFLLVVEGGMIDQAHHRGTARKALNEVLAFNEAINATINALGRDLKDTLVIVTADHSHTLSINGHAARGTDILGVAGNSKTEGTPYTILTYGTTYQGFQADENGMRVDPTLHDTTDWEYTQQGAINTDENYHGGSDVTIHATGAMSYLFHGVHEQSYVAHAISYALRIGRFRDSSIAESLAEFLPA